MVVPFFLDARLAVRRLLAAPGYTSAVVLTFALAIGANVAIFSAVDAVLLRALSIVAPDRVVIGWGTNPERNLPIVELSYRHVEYIAARTRTMANVAAIGSTSWPVVLDAPDRRIRLAATGVSTSFFDTLGVVPAVGRAFRPGDDDETVVGVVMLSHRLWTTRFGADPAVVGSTIRLPKPHVIVGVAPDGFDFPRGTDLWTPVVPVLRESAARSRIDALSDVGVLYLVGRLRDDASIESVRAELTTLAAELRQNGGLSLGSSASAQRLTEYVAGPIRSALWATLAAVALVFVVAVSNVSGLMVSRISLRYGELVTRLALGATRGDLAWLFVWEAILLSLAGGAAGLLTSKLITVGLVTLGSEQIPDLATMTTTSLSVTAFALIATVGAALTSAIAPVRVVSRLNRQVGLSRDSMRTAALGQTHNLRTALVVLQIALSVVLLVGSLLVLRSFENLRRIEVGFVPDEVMAMSVEPPAGVREPTDWLFELLSTTRELPDVQAVGAVSQRPLSGSIGDDVWVILDGQPDTPAARRRNPALNRLVATPGYFEALGIPLKRGRLFRSSDRTGTPLVAVVSERTARQLWPDSDPIGRRILMPAAVSRSQQPQWRTVVGIVGDVRYRGLADARFDVYDSALQGANPPHDVMIRSAASLTALQGIVQAGILRRHPGTLIYGVAPMRASVDAATSPWRFATFALTMFAVVAFAVAMVGVAGLVALDVSSRRRELAIRQALGAQRSSVLRSIVSRTASRAAVGLLFGLGLAASSTWFLRSLLFEVQPVDSATFAGVAALVAIVASLGCYIPARRGMALNVAELLRSD